MYLFFDIVGAAFSLIAAYLYVKENPLAWPVAALAMPFDIYLYLSKGLIADTFLQISYFLSTIYGWYQWCYGGGSHTTREIADITKGHVLILAAFGCPLYLLALSFIARHTSLNIAIFDTLASILSIVGQWLLCRKIRQVWWVFIAVDILYIGLYTIKALPFHALMMCIYLGMALKGLKAWRVRLITMDTQNSPSLSTS